MILEVTEAIGFFDAENVWLIDWMAAFVNDRYFDLTISVGFVVANKQDEEVMLAGYLGPPPNE